MLHHRQQQSSGGFVVRLGVVVVKLMADVRRQSDETVAWRLRQIRSANSIKAGKNHRPQI
jgi:hypothetical protein